MRGLLTLRKSLLAVVLPGLCGVAAAQSLGTPRGAVLLGRPLEITVPAQFEQPAADDRCARAEVFYGDTRIDAARVSTEMRRTARGDAIAISVHAPVNEPVVSVVVRAGCVNSSTRRYTLLPEPAPDEAAVVSRPARDARVTGAAPARTQAPVVARTAPAPAPALAPRREVERIEAAAPPDRLKIDLRLASLPVEDNARRAAAAMLWRALSAEPQDLQRTLHTLRGLESEIAVLRTSAPRSPVETALPREPAAPRELQARTRHTDSVSLLPLAGALLLAATLGIVWWRRRGAPAGSPRWYDSAYDSSLESGLPAPAAPAAKAAKAAKAAASVTLPVRTASMVEPPMRMPILRPLAAPAPVSAPRVDALFAVLQEVEFLESLGLLGDAIDTLKDYLQDVADPPALAFCELLRLCALNQDPVGVAAVRSRWQEAFELSPPTGEEVIAPAGVESQIALMSRITADWPARHTLELIESELFGRPMHTPRLSLQGWRDLLWLHGMARALLEGEAVGESADASRDAVTSWTGEVHEPGAVDLDVGAAPQRFTVVLQDEAVAAAVSELMATVPAPVAERMKSQSPDRDDLFDAFAAAEGKWAHRTS